MEFQSQKDRPTAQFSGLNMIARKRRAAGAVKIKIARLFLNTLSMFPVLSACHYSALAASWSAIFCTSANASSGVSCFRAMVRIALLNAPPCSEESVSL